MSSNKNQKTDEKKENEVQSQSAEKEQTAAPVKPEKDEETGVSADTTKQTVKMVLKHKSHTTNYHRCGLTLTKLFADYEVPAESVEKLKSDKWIVVQESK